ncbi:hypothetical protein BU204_32185 [Actinophytocola xanthii]|uniref:Fido domain-containing protein n=1 Tax=Actinophytocola xanthii TaxID=1912961 RepID=A0A1Q8C6L6_9PSEU|nr:hypothetical protein BU204_32185 [Actinophytocola xanthii]
MEFRTETAKAVARADHMLGRLDEAATRLPERGALVRATQWRELAGSWGADGTEVSVRDVFLQDLRGLRNPPVTDPAVAEYVAAADDAARRARAGEAIGVMLLRRTAARLPTSGTSTERGTDPPWRTTDRWFGARPSSAYLLAVPPGAELRTAAEQWVAWVDCPSDMPLIAKLALGAYQILTLAPLDNSEEVANLYVVLELIRAGALRDQILPVSPWLAPRSAPYHIRHRAVAEDGDLDGWIAFVAEGIARLCRAQLNIVDTVEELREEFLDRLGRRNDSLARAVNALLGTPVADQALIAERSGVSLRHSHDLIKRLRIHGVVREMGQRKQHKLHEVPAVMRVLGSAEDGA